MPKGIPWKKCACGNKIKIFKNDRYKRKFSDICQTCALKLNAFKPTHGHRTLGADGKSKRSPLYIKWVQMKMACYTPTNKDYRLIGAKGIIMDNDWHDFEGFYRWAAHRCGPGQKLKRIDVKKDFEPSNCKFISGHSNRFYEHDGEKLTFDSWKRRFNSQIKNETIRTRLEKKWLIPDAFTWPVGKHLGKNKRVKRSEQ